ncbi:MAG: glycosyltransferase family 1 protein [Epsilonproteobacteria bacterium]|nr:MAG: glycosyltransferase family 1 protein [Campylobacterota bacterium]
MDKPKIAFVVQRNGKEVNGGAEYLCFLTARLMLKYWDVEILTTCALDYMTWDNYYEEGLETAKGVAIRRFEVDHPRDVNAFNRYSDDIFSQDTSIKLEDAEQWMQMQGPMSSHLLAYIEEHQADYDKFFFFTYLYASSYYGLPIVAEKSFLVPTIHDEPPIYLPIWDAWFTLPQYLIYSTVEEKKFLEKRFPNVRCKSAIIGTGVDIPDEVSNIRFRQKYDLYHPYILYVGRIDPSKGVDHLFDYFLRYKTLHNTPLKLVLAGKSIMEIPKHSDIIHIGFVDKQTKFDGIAGCEFLVNSSASESLSMVLLEAWSLNRPVLVNEKSEVMVGQCRRSQGGLWYGSYKEFEINTRYLLEKSYIFTDMSSFVEEHYHWDIIRDKFLRILDDH